MGNEITLHWGNLNQIRMPLKLSLVWLPSIVPWAACTYYPLLVNWTFTTQMLGFHWSCASLPRAISLLGNKEWMLLPVPHRPIQILLILQHTIWISKVFSGTALQDAMSERLQPHSNIASCCPGVLSCDPGTGGPHCIVCFGRIEPGSHICTSFLGLSIWFGFVVLFSVLSF